MAETPKPRPKSLRRLQQENAALRKLIDERQLPVRLKKVDAVVKLGSMAIKWGVIGFVAWCSYQSIAVVSGTTTKVGVAVNFLANVTVSQWTAWLLAGLFGGMAWRQRKLRRDTVEQLSEQKTKLEKALDPGRSSSKLTARGDTHPGDE